MTSDESNVIGWCKKTYSLKYTHFGRTIDLCVSYQPNSLILSPYFILWLRITYPLKEYILNYNRGKSYLVKKVCFIYHMIVMIVCDQVTLLKGLYWLTITHSTLLIWIKGLSLNWEYLSFYLYFISRISDCNKRLLQNRFRCHIRIYLFQVQSFPKFKVNWGEIQYWISS